MGKRGPKTKIVFTTIPAGPPQAPASLTGEALDKWHEIVKLLEGVATSLDGDALALYCSTWAIARQAERAIRSEGLLVVGYRGADKPNPAIAILERANRLLLDVAAKFGLTPADRANPTMPADPAAKLMAERFFD